MNTAEVSDYNRVALGVNAPIYEFYAQRILERTGINAGCCLDAGCGGGHLGLALARITSLDFILLDRSPDMLRCAEENIGSHGLTTRARTLLADVQALPLPDASIDLVISRGSVPFWDDLPAVFREIKRVLKPGGRGYIGGGRGNPEMRAAIWEQLKKEHPEWQRKQQKIPHHEDGHYAAALEAAGIESFTVTRSDEGMWIELGKERSEE